jgi:hypothetical protein
MLPHPNLVLILFQIQAKQGKHHVQQNANTTKSLRKETKIASSPEQTSLFEKKVNRTRSKRHFFFFFFFFFSQKVTFTHLEAKKRRKNSDFNLLLHFAKSASKNHFLCSWKKGLKYTKRLFFSNSTHKNQVKYFSFPSFFFNSTQKFTFSHKK